MCAQNPRTAQRYTTRIKCLLAVRSAMLCNLWVASSSLHAQNDGTCYTEGDPILQYDEIQCGFRIRYTPDPAFAYQNMPINVMKLNFHFLRGPGGSGTYQGDQASNIAQMLVAVNQVFSSIQPPTLPVDIDPPVALVEDTRIRFELNDIHYHDSPGYANISAASFDTPVLGDGLEADGPFVYDVIYFTTVGENGAGVTWGTSIYMRNSGLGGPPRLLAHELGHALGLQHTFGPFNTECNDDDCVDTYYPDFNRNEDACDPNAPYDAYWAGQFLCSGIGISNNIMGYNGCRNYFSPQQIATMRRSIVRTFQQGLGRVPKDWVQCQPSSLATETHIVNNAFWNMSQALNKDLIIEEGAELTITCRVSMGSNAKIIVKPGASLIVDGGIVTSLNGSCSSFWPGIEVWGTTSQHQFPTGAPAHQGILILKNGAVIEHAREGAQNWKPDDYNSIGGVIQVLGTHAQIGGTFRNCRRALKFQKYQNYLPGYPDVRAPDHSYFNYAHFEYDEYYREGDYVYAPVVMWGTDGIVFRACTLENKQLTSIDPPFANQSSQLGKGIISADASFTVCGACAVQQDQGMPCPQLDRSEFIGFDHGISAVGTAGSSASFAVYDTHFKDNVCGVYVNGVVGYQVKGCTIEIGGRSVDLNTVEEEFWGGFQRGIYSTESWAFAVEDNMVGPSGTYPFREAIVIGYNRDHNDVVFRNTVNGLEVGYVGEGIAASLTDPAWIGLNWMCNLNEGNVQNFWSRRIGNAQGSNPDEHTVRTNQGSSDRPADNTFDRVAGPLGVGDYEVTTVNGTITYWHRNIETPYEPAHVRQSTVPPTWLEPEVCTTVPVQDNCARKIKHQIALDPGHPSGLDAGDIQEHLTAEKIAYGNTRYLYNDLIDGGNTDEVVLEIMAAWPQDAWELRDYLLGLSPFLSVEALKEAMDKPGFPAAMKAEVCIANPDATQREGFMTWLRTECLYPLPEYMLEAIVASWDTRTYRSSLETEMAYHHGEMSQAANMLLHRHALDDDGAQPAERRAVWQQVRTPAARYAEALTWLDEGNMVAAADVIESIPLEHDLRAPEMLERQRMLDLIAYMEPIRLSGRNDAQLSTGEVEDLEALRGDAYDRPATWVSNLLCFHYGICRPDLTGGEQGDPKSLRQVQRVTTDPEVEVYLTLYPNPTEAWAVVNYRIPEDVSTAVISMRDLVGREVLRMPLKDRIGQVVLDTRGLAQGTYQLVLVSGTSSLQTETIIIRQ